MDDDPDPTSNPGDQGRVTPTPLQEDIATLVAEGHSNREIAERLALTPEAVSNEMAGLFRALGVISRVEIALWAIEHELHR